MSEMGQSIHQISTSNKRKVPLKNLDKQIECQEKTRGIIALSQNGKLCSHITEIGYWNLDSRGVGHCWDIALSHFVGTPAFYGPISGDGTRVPISCRNADPVSCAFCIALTYIICSPAFKVTIGPNGAGVPASCRYINPFLGRSAASSYRDITLFIIIFT